ncbi:MAG: hypothetical protein WCA77_08820 [Thermoplasmata archaeon]
MFNSGGTHGLPALIAERLNGQFTEVEGLTRLSVLLSNSMNDEAVPSHIDVLIGLLARAREWSWF